MGFFYLSQVLKRPVTAAEARVAKVYDLVARLEILNASTGEVTLERFPPISGLVADVRGREVFIPWTQVESLGPEGARLNSARIDLLPFERRAGEVLLYRDLLDKQLIDIDGRRVIRANDLQLYSMGSTVRLTAVDVSVEAIMRRLSYGRLFTGTEQLFNPPDEREEPPRRRGREAPARLIAWPDVEPITADVPDVRLAKPHDRIALLHPVDIAHILDDLSYAQGAEIFESLDDETAAEALQEVHEDRQSDFVEAMDRERAADILEEMDPDNAADLLQDLDEMEKEEILRRMDREEAEDVEELLAYEEDTAGGIMTSRFITVPQRLSVDQTIQFLRHLQDAPDLIDYLYVVEEKHPAGDWVEEEGEGGGRLLGIVRLRDLLLSAGDTCLEDIMDTELVWVHPDEDKERAARTMAEYNLIALPVLDEDERILGIITVDDAMEVLLPERLSRRLPHVFS
jgi:CBS domain-containing protein